MKSLFLLALMAALVPNPSGMPFHPTRQQVEPGGAPQIPLRDPREKHLRNIKQLTFGKNNAEAYWSWDGKWLIYQTDNSPNGADQMYVMHPDGSGRHLVSTGHGKCTCGYFFPGDKKILFSSTHWADPAAPPRPDYSKGYVWQMFKSYAIFTAKPDGSNLKQLTHFGNYTAESTINKRGEIVFTRIVNGDLDIFKMDKNGKNLKRLTNRVGYDGGPFWSPDGKKIVYRRSEFKNQQELDEYKENLKQNLYRPTALEIWIMDADGSHKRQLTHMKAASFAPYMHPDGKHVLFASNHPDVTSREFDIYMIRTDGTGLERITYTPQFDGFPMFSPDGKKLVFCSNRNGKTPHETNVFIADWVW